MGVLAKITVLDRIEILEDGTLQIRRATYVTEDAVRISEPRYSREVFVPGQTLPNRTEARLTAVSVAVWTKDVVDAYIEKVARATATAVAAGTPPVDIGRRP